MLPAKHILFVEDESDFREGLSTLLELKGFRVGWASTGREDLDYLRQCDRPDLILLDLKLPDMDGSQFRREQQHDPALAPIPVVVISGAADGEEPLDAAGHVQKPFKGEELLDASRALG